MPRRARRYGSSARNGESSPEALGERRAAAAVGVTSRDDIDRLTDSWSSDCEVMRRGPRSA